MAKPYHRRAVSSVKRAYSKDPHERFESISGVNADHTLWTLPQAAAIALIEKGTNEFFVQVDNHPVRLVVLTRAGEKYLQSERDKTHPDDLFNLPVPVVQPATPSLARSHAAIAAK